MPSTSLLVQALPDIPLVQAGDDLVTFILEALTHLDLGLQPNDVLVISSKIVSKAENRFVDLRDIKPSPRAEELAVITRKDPRFVEVVLRESQEVSRVAPNVLVVRHCLGFTSANAGIDQSNTGYTDSHMVLLLPQDPDASADYLASEIATRTGVRPAVVISDTHGRPFRMGNLNVAIGISGLAPLIDQRGETDLFGRMLQATVTAFADQVTAAAGLVSGETSEGQPVILIRGLVWPHQQNGTAQSLNRPPEQDLYR